MRDNDGLQRFLSAQEGDYETARKELQAGRKRSHWMWYIFPQVSGLGFSSMSGYYGIKGLKEAEAYLQHPVLGARLLEITKVLLNISSADATAIFGSPDDLKLRSCMTLFRQVPGSSAVFQQVLDKFFSGEPDQNTLRILAHSDPA